MPKSLKQVFFLFNSMPAIRLAPSKLKLVSSGVFYLLAKLSLVLPPLLFQAVKRGGVLQHFKSAHGKHLRPIGFQGEI